MEYKETRIGEDLSSTTFLIKIGKGFIQPHFFSCKKKSGAGFTLIELLVVIAIIGMLSSIVLASLNSARGKASDTAVKENLHNLRAQAQLLYENNNGNYTGICIGSDPKIQALMQAASQAGVGNTTSWGCATGGGVLFTSYAIYAPMKSLNLYGASSGTDYWCVDSAGSSKLEDVIANTGSCQ